MIRCRLYVPHMDAPAGAPSVSIVIPVCGLDNHIEVTLRSSFLLDYPRYELLFCAAQAGDPAIPVVRRLMAEYPWIDARLLIGDERISANPKLNNIFKGWRAAAYSWIAIPDSNALLRRDYLQRLFAGMRPDVGLVSSPPIGVLPKGFWAEVECALLNGHQARWQYFADTIGFGFAQGKTMLWRRDILERAGGIRALGREAAEDAASTKIVRAAGLNVRLADPPVCQPLGERNAAQVWKRQRRWARLRRATFPLFFVPELFCGGLVPAFALAFVLGGGGLLDALPSALVTLAFLAAWYGAELVLAWKSRWPLSRYSLPSAIVRDLMLPLLWIDAWTGNGFEWRGTEMRAVESARVS